MRLSVLLLLLLSVACSSADESTPATETNPAGTSNGGSSTASSAGLGQACPSAGCASGQTCMTNNGPEGATQTCEIKCNSQSECPAGTKCQLPPLVPDAIPNVCVN